MLKRPTAIFAIALTAIGILDSPVWAQTTPQAQLALPFPYKLTAVELRAIIVGNTTYAQGQYGPKTFTSYFTADGQVRMRAPDVRDEGTYRITDDGVYCSKYKVVRGGQETCQTAYQTGPNAFESHLPTGSILKWSMVPGNPDRL